MDTVTDTGIPAFDEILDDFELLEDWEDRYRYVIELGRGLAPLPEEVRARAATLGRPPAALEALSWSV